MPTIDTRSCSVDDTQEFVRGPIQLDLAIKREILVVIPSRYE
jgi:hypothetical protein